MNLGAIVNCRFQASMLSVWLAPSKQELLEGISTPKLANLNSSALDMDMDFLYKNSSPK